MWRWQTMCNELQAKTHAHTRTKSRTKTNISHNRHMDEKMSSYAKEQAKERARTFFKSIEKTTPVLYRFILFRCLIFVFEQQHQNTPGMEIVPLFWISALQSANAMLWLSSFLDQGISAVCWVFGQMHMCWLLVVKLCERSVGQSIIVDALG